MSLHFLHYNFAQPHKSLSKRMEDPINAVNTTTLGRTEGEIKAIETKVGV